MQFKTYNAVVYAIAERAAELSQKKIDDLRLAAGYECLTPADARNKNKHSTRGEMINEILTEEFIEEFDYTIEER